MIVISFKERNVIFDFKDLNNDVLYVRKVIFITKLLRFNKMDIYYIFLGVEYCRFVFGLLVDYYYCFIFY